MMLILDEGYLMSHEGYVEAYEFALAHSEIDEEVFVNSSQVVRVWWKEK